jgi:hypothetical protein
MTDYINPLIKKYCVNQEDPFTCWAAVGETMRRYKLKTVPKTDFGKYLETLKNSGYSDCYALGTAAGKELKLYPTIGLASAEQNARNKSATFNKNTPSGLPADMAVDLYQNQMGMKFKSYGTGSDQLNARDTTKLLNYIKRNSPLVIFTGQTNGHIRIIIGYWYYSEETKTSPQIILFDPEAAMLGKHPYQPLLWTHFIDQVVDNFSENCEGFFHW